MQKDSFIRWQEIRINQLSYSINLILGLSVGILGFQVTLLLNDKFIVQGLQKCLFSSSLVIIATAILFGIFCTISRLLDFRETAEIARSKKRGDLSRNFKEGRDLTKNLGEITWFLFWCQIGAFIIGVLFLVATIAPLLV